MTTDWKNNAFARFVLATLKGFQSHSCALHAAGLTYFSILALVPVLCLMMVFAKTCGAGDLARGQINKQIDAFVVQIEEGKEEGKPEHAEVKKELMQQVRTVSNEMFDRIDKFEVGTLGWVGFVMLMWTVISTFGQVETSFNEVWEVKKARPVWKKSALYLFIALVLPVFAAAALSMPVLRVTKAALDATLGSTSYTKWAGEALVAVIDSRAFAFGVTFTFSAGAFAFLLKVIPNCRVSGRAALAGGALTAAMLGVWLKVCTKAGVGIAQSSALYGSFAAVPILLAWLYMSWQIVLLGGNMTYALQNLHDARGAGGAGAADGAAA